MKHRPIVTSLSMLVILGLPSTGLATEFNQVLADKSTLVFNFKQMGVGLAGSFKRFAAQLNFDTNKVESAKASVDVDLASIDTGSSEGDDEVAGKQWFDTKVFPTARFVSGHIRSLGSNRYEVAGQLSIKGRTHPVTAIATMTTQGNVAQFDGSFAIKRADFAIGEGPWADFGTVANEVQITFHILANARK